MWSKIDERLLYHNIRTNQIKKTGHAGLVQISDFSSQLPVAEGSKTNLSRSSIVSDLVVGAGVESFHG